MPLGRGLGALISGSPKKQQDAPSDIHDKIWHIPVSSISPNANQPRQNFGPAELEELSASIKTHGILQPLLLSEKADGGYEIIAGERRYRAAKMAGLTTVPAIIKKLPEHEKVEVALIENIQREDLNPIEEAFAYQRLMEEFDLTQQEVSDKVGKSRPSIANAIRLLSLPEPIKTALIEKRINMSQARALLSLDDEKKQIDLLSSMLGQRITVRELERTVSKDSKNSRRDPNLTYLEDKLRTALGTKVSITQKGENGTVAISYYSKEELARIIAKISE
ncbi:MAG: ParB/RepB/Spo0J family partition protein [Patescibacteria group bacterium]